MHLNFSLIRSRQSTPRRTPCNRGERKSAFAAPDATGRAQIRRAPRSAAARRLSNYETDDALAVWAYRTLHLKNTLTKEDSEALEAAYLSKAASIDPSVLFEANTSLSAQEQEHEISSTANRNDVVAPIDKPVRKRSKAHLAFVASQACLICKAAPCDAHHLKMARPRSLGRKVSDEFTVPLCRKHHQELHRHGNEANWWANMQVAPLPIAKDLWEGSPIHVAEGPTAADGGVPILTG